ncbi:MAG: hypothetical protein N2517_00660 [Ignavibacteria bacterium]|nr:hypothetical protein [Ignavibacteria bacterium]
MKEIRRAKQLLTMVIFVAFGFGCSGPVDIETPRRVTPVDRNQAFIRPRITMIVFDENGAPNPYFSFAEPEKQRDLLIKKHEILVDTLVSPSRIWFRYIVEHIDKKKLSRNQRLTIYGMNFNFDSLPITGVPISFTNGKSKTSWVKFLLNRGRKDNFDTIIDPTLPPNSFEIDFILNKAQREVWARGYTKIYDKRFTVVFRDTTVIDSVKKIKYDTIWVGTERIIKEIEYWEKNEIKLRIEEITSYPDSLFVNFRFKMRY